jgi:hypothetical protein
VKAVSDALTGTEENPATVAHITQIALTEKVGSAVPTETKEKVQNAAHSAQIAQTDAKAVKEDLSASVKKAESVGRSAATDLTEEKAARDAHSETEMKVASVVLMEIKGKAQKNVPSTQTGQRDAPTTEPAITLTGKMTAAAVRERSDALLALIGLSEEKVAKDALSAATDQDAKEATENLSVRTEAKSAVLARIVKTEAGSHMAAEKTVASAALMTQTSAITAVVALTAATAIADIAAKISRLLVRSVALAATEALKAKLLASAAVLAAAAKSSRKPLIIT